MCVPIAYTRPAFLLPINRIKLMIIVCKCGERRTSQPYKDSREKKVEKCLACSPGVRFNKFVSISVVSLRDLRRKVMLKDRDSTCGPKSGNEKK